MTAPQPPYANQPQPPYGQYPTPYQNPYAPWGVDRFGRPLSDKSKVAAGLLSFFLGAFGVGRFYLGYTTFGVLQIVITVLSLGMLGWVWPVVDTILILTGNVPDAQGRTLRD